MLILIIVEIGKYIGSSVHRRSYLLWSPVIHTYLVQYIASAGDTSACRILRTSGYSSYLMRTIRGAYEPVPAKGETFWFRNFAPWLSRVGETIFGMVVLHGNVKKTEDWSLFEKKKMFWKRSFEYSSVFYRVNSTLADTRTTQKIKKYRVLTFFQDCHEEQPGQNLFPNSKPWSKSNFPEG